MPFAEITVTKKLMTEEKKTKFIKKITKILIESEGLQDNPISRSIALVDFKEFDNLYIGGDVSTQERIVVKIYGFSDAFDEDAKKKLFENITNSLMEINETIRLQNGRNVWCIIIPLGKSEFGVGGMPISLDITRQLVASYQS